MKLVLTRKPLLEGGDLTKEKHLKDQIPKAASDLTAASAQELAELAELAAFKAKCGLVVCGNFEQQPGDDISSQNVDADTLRFLAHKWHQIGTKITMKPPAILAKMDSVVLPAAGTDELGDLVLHPHSDIPGLWTVLDGEAIVGYVTMFVDDGLGIGHSEAMLRVVDHIRNTWKATAEGYMGWDDGHSLSRGSLTVPRVSEFIFLTAHHVVCRGLIANFSDLSLDQHKWLAQELQKRALTQMTGTGCLPNLDDAPCEPESRGDAYEKDVKACQREVGSMMWVAMRKTLWISLRFIGSDSRIITVYTAETEAIATGYRDSGCSSHQSIIQGLTNMHYDIEAVSDSASAVVLICKPTMSTLIWRTRHFGLRAAWIRDQVAEHAIAVRHESGETLIATKG
ncbi:unnamed protein product [Symbiodinium sp. KB8]|nr:unnamed protein product [Symbiodinium sp. KB8]